MLNIFAEAMLIAARMDQRAERYLPRRDQRRSPREFMEIESLNSPDQIDRRGR